MIDCKIDLINQIKIKYNETNIILSNLSTERKLNRGTAIKYYFIFL